MNLEGVYPLVESLRDCSFCTYSGFRNTNRSENTRSFWVNRNIIVLVINQARAGLPFFFFFFFFFFFLLVYLGLCWFTVGGNPKTRRNTNTHKWVGIFFFFFMLEHRRFRFFPCLREQPGKQSSARSPSSKYRLSYVGKHNKLFLVLFRIFLTAFPFEKDGCQHSSSSPFLAGNHEYTFED